MKPSEFFEKFEDLQGMDLGVARQKNHDYAGTEDALDNFREFGFIGVIIRMNDKMKRLIHFLKDGKFEVSDESVHDTLSDLRIYATIAEIVYQEENK